MVAHHTPYATGAPLTHTELDRPLQELDVAIDEEAALRDVAISEAATVEAASRTAAIDAETTRALAAESAISLAGAGVTTTLDGSAAAGQKVIPVTSTTGLLVGASPILTDGTNTEPVVIASVSAGVSVTATTNLAHSYAVGTILSLSDAEVALARGSEATLGTRIDRVDTIATTGNVAGALQRFLGKLARDASDATMVIVGDSTAAIVGAWPDLMMAQLALDHPTMSVKTAKWDGTATMAYPAETTVATGSGANTIHVWVAAVGGKNVCWFLHHLYEMVGAKSPDLVLVNLGMNEVYATNVTATDARSRMLALTESILLVAPLAGVALIAQNERTDTSPYKVLQRAYMAEYATIAAVRGYGWFDVYDAFRTAPGGAAAYEDPDGIHPNASGWTLWWNTMRPAFTHRPFNGQLTQPQTTLAGGSSPNLLVNGDFATFASPPTLTGWTASGVTLSKDATNYESTGHAWGVRGVASGAAASYISQQIGGPSASPNRLKAILGQWLTIAARCRVDAATGTTSGGQVGMAQLGGAGPFPYSVARGLQHYDRWAWNVQSMYVNPDATSVTAYYYFDSTANASAAGVVDRIVCVRGILPRDIQ